MSRMRRTLVVLVALIAATSLPVVLAQDAVKTPTGFSRASADANAKFERIVLDTPTPDNARKWLMALTEEPHVAGTPAEKKVAEWVRDKLKEFGLDVEMVKYDVFLNHPRSVSPKRSGR